MLLRETANRVAARERLVALQTSGVGAVGEAEARQVLGAWGLPFGRGCVLSEDDDVQEALSELTLPVVLKIDAEAYPHKTEHGLVVLDCRTPDDVSRAHAQLIERVQTLGLARDDYKLLVEEMISGDTEWILGIRNEPALGTAVVFGAGGIFTELLDDVVVGMYPLDAHAADLMLETLRMRPALFGFRGRLGVAKETLVGALQAAATFGYDCREIVSTVDINPIIIGGEYEQLVAVDALIRLRDPDETMTAEQTGA